jgi:uncharacterized protein YqgV (UPF0045/DUF77 family)
METTFVLDNRGTLIAVKAVDLLQIAISLYKRPFEQGTVGLMTQVTIDDRTDKI